MPVQRALITRVRGRRLQTDQYDEWASAHAAAAPAWSDEKWARISATLGKPTQQQKPTTDKTPPATRTEAAA